MKDYLNKYLDRAKKLLVRNQVGADNDFTQSRDWFLGLIGAAAVALVLLGVSTYEFITTDDGYTAPAAPPSASSTVLEKDQLRTVLDAYRARTETFGQLKTQPEQAPRPNGALVTAPVPVATTTESSAPTPVTTEGL